MDRPQRKPWTCSGLREESENLSQSLHGLSAEKELSIHTGVERERVAFSAGPALRATGDHTHVPTSGQVCGAFDLDLREDC